MTMMQVTLVLQGPCSAVAVAQEQLQLLSAAAALQ